MKVKGDRDRRTGRGPGKKGGGKERAWITGQTGRREYTPFVCVCWAEERMKTQSISHLLYYPITFYARAHLHPTLISLSPLAPCLLSILSLLVAWNHHYADNHKWRVEKRGENAQGGREGGTSRGDKRGRVRQRRGSNGLSLRDWKSCPIYDYVLRDNNESNRRPTDRENESTMIII